MKRQITLVLLLLLLKNLTFTQQVNAEQTYPKIAGYTAVVIPIVTFDKNGTTFNFENSYTIGFPVGINILKSAKIGFSFEIAPFIKVENGTDKVNNLSFNPGIMFLMKHGFTFITRLAFETSGRYGVTPVFNKVLFKTKDIKGFAVCSVPLRFGNDKPISVGFAVQFGIGF